MFFYNIALPCLIITWQPQHMYSVLHMQRSWSRSWSCKQACGTPCPAAALQSDLSVAAGITVLWQQPRWSQGDCSPYSFMGFPPTHLCHWPAWFFHLALGDVIWVKKGEELRCGKFCIGDRSLTRWTLPSFLPCDPKICWETKCLFPNIGIAVL